MKPNMRKWQVWTGFIVLLFSLWFGTWFVMVNIGEGMMNGEIARARDSGIDISCRNQKFRGFPFRIGVFCDRVAVLDRRANILIETSSLRTTALLHKPKHTIVELDPPLLVTAKNSAPLTIHWSSLRASINAAKEGAEKTAIVGKEIEIQFPKKLGGVLDGIEVKSSELHLRPSETGSSPFYDLALSLSDMQSVPERLIAGEKLSAAIDLQIGEDILRYLPLPVKSARKPPNIIKGKLRSLIIKPQSGGSIRLSGPFDVDMSGLLSGKIRVVLVNIDALENINKSAVAEISGLLKQIFSGIRSGGDVITVDNQPALRITLTLERGVVSFGDVQVGRIPPLSESWWRSN